METLTPGTVEVGATMEQKLREARAAIEAAKRKQAVVTTLVREARVALEKAEQEEDFVAVSNLRHALNEAIEDAADVQIMDEIADAENALQDLLSEQRRATLEEYRRVADPLLAAAEALAAAWHAEMAWRKGRHAGIKSDDMLPLVSDVPTSLLSRWAIQARRRHHCTFNPE